MEQAFQERFGAQRMLLDGDGRLRTWLVVIATQVPVEAAEKILFYARRKLPLVHVLDDFNAELLSEIE